MASSFICCCCVFGSFGELSRKFVTCVALVTCVWRDFRTGWRGVQFSETRLFFDCFLGIIFLQAANASLGMPATAAVGLTSEDYIGQPALQDRRYGGGPIPHRQDYIGTIASRAPSLSRRYTITIFLIFFGSAGSDETSIVARVFSFDHAR